WHCRGVCRHHLWCRYGQPAAAADRQQAKGDCPAPVALPGNASGRAVVDCRRRKSALHRIEAAGLHWLGERAMARRRIEEEHENHERWLVSYADFITLLFAFFVVMYSISSINEGKYRVLSDSLVNAFRNDPAVEMAIIKFEHADHSPKKPIPRI